MNGSSGGQTSGLTGSAEGWVSADRLADWWEPKEHNCVTAPSTVLYYPTAAVLPCHTRYPTQVLGSKTIVTFQGTPHSQLERQSRWRVWTLL